MAVEELMDKLVPLPRVLLKGSCVPEILVELAVCEPGYLGVEVRSQIEHDHETTHLEDAYWNEHLDENLFASLSSKFVYHRH